MSFFGSVDIFFFVARGFFRTEFSLFHPDNLIIAKKSDIFKRLIG
jgi:hypothetical protein